MESESQTTSGVDAATSGAETDVQSSSSGEGIPRSHLEKVLKESKNKTSRIKELEAQILETQEGKLIEDQKWKEIAEQRLEALTKATDKNQAFEIQTDQARKIGAVKKHLVQLGLRSEHEDLALNKLLDVNGLTIDPDTGVVLGSEDLAKDFRKLYSTLGIFGKSVPGVNQDAPSSQASTMSKPLSGMSREELKQEMIRNLAGG